MRRPVDVKLVRDKTALFALTWTAMHLIDESSPFYGPHAMERLAADGQLVAFRHSGFWKCMDTLRDKNQLSELWNQGNAPWKTWAD